MSKNVQKSFALQNNLDNITNAVLLFMVLPLLLRIQHNHFKVVRNWWFKKKTLNDWYFWGFCISLFVCLFFVPLFPCGIFNIRLLFDRSHAFAVSNWYTTVKKTEECDQKQQKYGAVALIHIYTQRTSHIQIGIKINLARKTHRMYIVRIMKVQAMTKRKIEKK